MNNATKLLIAEIERLKKVLEAAEVLCRAKYQEEPMAEGLAQLMENMSRLDDAVNTYRRTPSSIIYRKED